MNHGCHPLKHDATSLRNGFRSSSYLLIGWIHDRCEQVVTERVEAHQPETDTEKKLMKTPGSSDMLIKT